MDNASIRDGIYTITHEGQAALYRTESFGALRDVLDLLNTVNRANRRHPDVGLPDARRLLCYSRSMIPFEFYQPNRLFQPLEQEEFDVIMEGIKDGDEDTAHYVLDYDKNQFAMTSWDDGRLCTVRAPLQGILDAYNGAIRNRGLVRQYINEKVFAADVERIASIEFSADSPAEPEQTTEMEPDGPSGFTGPSM